MRRHTFVLVLLMAMWRCSSTSPTPTVMALTIACDTTALTTIGQQAHCSARATLSNNQTDDRTAVAQWSSSDASKVSVNGGVVTAIAAGSAVITASVTGLTAQQTVVVNTSCTFSLSPASASFAPAGGSQSVSVTVSPAGCSPASWTAVSNNPGLAVSPGSGNGSGAVTVTVAPNGAGAQTANATIAGQTFTANIGAACSYSFTPAALDAGNGWNVPAAIAERSVSVTVNGSGCAPWTTQTSDGWVSVSQSTGTTSATVRVFAAANTGPARSGFVVFAPPACGDACGAGVTVVLNQSATTATLSLTLTEGEVLSGPYAGVVTGPNGFRCAQAAGTTTCPPLVVPSGTIVTLIVTLTVPTFPGPSPIRSVVGCDSSTRNSCTVLMNRDRNVTISIGCEVACSAPAALEPLAAESERPVLTPYASLNHPETSTRRRSN